MQSEDVSLTQKWDDINWAPTIYAPSIGDLDTIFMLKMALKLKGKAWGAVSPLSSPPVQACLATFSPLPKGVSWKEAGLSPKLEQIAAWGLEPPLPFVLCTGSGMAPVFEVRWKPHRQGCCPPALWPFSTTFSLGKVPVFISKYHISLNGAICFKCLLHWRLPHLTIGIIKGKGSPPLLPVCAGSGRWLGAAGVYARLPSQRRSLGPPALEWSFSEVFRATLQAYTLPLRFPYRAQLNNRQAGYCDPWSFLYLAGKKCTLSWKIISLDGSKSEFALWLMTFGVFLHEDFPLLLLHSQLQVCAMVWFLLRESLLVPRNGVTCRKAPVVAGPLWSPVQLPRQRPRLSSFGTWVFITCHSA